MKTTIFAILGLLLLVSPTYAHGDGGGFGGLGDFGGFGFGFGGGHRDFGGFGGFGGDFGLGFFDAESAQTRFESQFDSLKTKYDDGVANVTDFFTSTQYDNIVSKTERLDDRYGLFVSSVDTKHRSNCRSDFDDERRHNLLQQLAGRLSGRHEPCRPRGSIESKRGSAGSRIGLPLGSTSLTDKQTTLQTNLPTYQTFQTTIDTFLSDIQAAGGGTSERRRLRARSR